MRQQSKEERKGPERGRKSLESPGFQKASGTMRVAEKKEDGFTKLSEVFYCHEAGREGEKVSFVCKATEKKTSLKEEAEGSLWKMISSRDLIEAGGHQHDAICFVISL